MKVRMMLVWSVSVTVGAEKRPQLTLGDQFLLENDLFRSSTSAQYPVTSTLGAQHQHLTSWPVPSSKFKVQPRGVIWFLSIFWYMTEDSQNIFTLINNGFDCWANLEVIPSDFCWWNIQTSNKTEITFFSLKPRWLYASKQSCNPRKYHRPPLPA